MEYMCGRFAVTTDPALLAEKIKAIDEATGTAPDTAAPNNTAPNYPAPNYNVAPTSTIATCSLSLPRRVSSANIAPTGPVRW